ncbi:MAG: extensin family protein [Sphingopyxis sp.]|nr:extensin family protein [Sphingopyxis sp.]
MQWVRDHPEHIPTARFELAHPQGWATHRKLVGLVGDDAACFAALDRAGAGYERRPAVGTGTCRASQRMVLTGNRFVPTMRPANAAPGCAVTVAMALWNRDVVQPLALKHFGQRVVALENLGSYNCRSVRGGQAPSQHSTANAIDISAFVLADGTRISLINDWDDADVRREFLRAVRDGSCGLFSTVLSPDYNQPHADHFHFDMAERTAGWTVCR